MFKLIDIYYLLRYWSAKENKVATRFLHSAFLLRTRATELLAAFIECLQDVGIRKVLAISMDGPSVNWKFLSSLDSKKEEDGKSHSNASLYSKYTTTNNSSAGMPGLLKVGSCSLHVVHQASSVGEAQTGWDLKCLLSSGYYLFKDSPKRRSDFIAISSTVVFPLKFCAVRWCENLTVAKRFLELLPALEAYCQKVDPKPNHLKSFTTIEKAIKDPLLKAKLGFFISVQLMIQPFLKKYQTTSPMAPFLFGDLHHMLYTLAARLESS
jgi:hypothetical protein